jgi:site-specific recombinase XerD
VPKKLPVVLSPEEVVQFLHLVWRRKHLAILTTWCAAGLRISEAVAFTPAAIEQGKGKKDRYVLPGKACIWTLAVGQFIFTVATFVIVWVSEGLARVTEGQCKSQ